MLMRLLALALVALPLPALAQAANPAPIPTDVPGVVIPAARGERRAIRYQVQGSGYACVSFQTKGAAVTISGNAPTATCGGAGSFLVTAGSTDNRLGPSPVYGAPLYGIGAPGSSLQISYEEQ